MAFIPIQALPLQRRTDCGHGAVCHRIRSSASAQEVIVIGGGAAGFYLAREAAQGGAQVTILEAGARVLRKVRASGGGRCNITSGLFNDDHVAFASNYARGARAMPGVLARHSATSVRKFFEDAGVPLKVESTGKVFPVSDTAGDVVHALVDATRALGVGVRTKCRVSDVHPVGAGGPGGFIVRCGDEDLHADVVALTTGDASGPLRWAEQMGHRIVPQVPSLFSFVIGDELLADLQGLSVPDAELKFIFERKRGRGRGFRLSAQRGPVLVTHCGLSGPAVLALSSYGARALHEVDYKAVVSVNWVAGLSRAEKEGLISNGRKRYGGRLVTSSSPIPEMPRRLWCALCQGSGVKPKLRWGDLSNAVSSALVDTLHGTKLHIEGRGAFKEEFVTAGGVALSEVALDTFESKKVAGLYFAGEVLDVDGRTGGFNLEFAWSSGYIAGTSIAARCRCTHSGVA